MKPDFVQFETDFIAYLQTHLSEKLRYHNLQHTLDVTLAAELIALAENCTREEISLIKTAALLHDSGFVFRYAHNEELAVELAKEKLPAYEYSPEQIQHICEMIESTSLTYTPKHLHQKIIKDADCSYMASGMYIRAANNLYEELRLFGYDFTPEQWLEEQHKFLKSHVFYTTFALNNWEKHKQEILKNLPE